MERQISLRTTARNIPAASGPSASLQKETRFCKWQAWGQEHRAKGPTGTLEKETSYDASATAHEHGCGVNLLCCNRIASVVEGLTLADA